MRDATRVVRAATPPASQGEPFLPGPSFAARYHAAGDPATVPYTYGRFHVQDLIDDLSQARDAARS